MLVSVVVVSYNSEKYIIDCLSSIYNQDYKDVELIISDDCSRDNTVNIVRNWISSHSDRFYKCILLESIENNGVSANCNKGVVYSSGKWLKLLAADDYLYSNLAISTFVGEAIKSNNKILFSNIAEVCEDIEKEQNSKIINLMKMAQNKPDKWLDYAVLYNFIPACSQFLEKESFVRLGGFDERIRNIEDAPMWIKYSSNGLAFGYVDKQLVAYRKHDESLVAQFKGKINIGYYDDILKIYELYRIPHARGVLKILLKESSSALSKFIIEYKKNSNKSNYYSLRIFKLLRCITYIYRRIRGM